MKVPSDFVVGAFVWLLVLVIFVSADVLVPLTFHKHAMERISGHKISWWDAYWTK